MAGISVRPRAGAALTFEARALRYVVLGGTDEHQAHAQFTPDQQHSGATFAEPDATLDLRDDTIAVAKVLPRNGLIRVRNRGTRPHYALAMRFPAGTTAIEAGAALKKGKSPELIGDPVDLSGLISADARRRRADAQARPLRHRLLPRALARAPGRTSTAVCWPPPR